MGFTGCIWLSYPWRDRDLFWPVDSYNQLYRAISNSQVNHFQPTTLKQAPTWAESDELLLLCSKAAASFSWPARKQASTTWFKQPKVSEDDQSQLMRLMHLLYLIITCLYLCQHSPAERRLHQLASYMRDQPPSKSALLRLGKAHHIHLQLQPGSLSLGGKSLIYPEYPHLLVDIQASVSKILKQY